ncbi:PQQ-dependent sugar dehydrogenase [Paenibacillus sp. 1P07SE]|uniref:PQQ-dependent sugar dehydrogenase n=1 Tax=Paenibacillus sp. 1P07SE TaxID=3132209 RepID=UPI0039A51D19
MKTWKLPLVTAAALLLGACGSPENNAPVESAPPPENQSPAESPAEPPQEEPEPSGEGYQVLTGQLEAPWSIAHDADTIYVSEREGSIVSILDGELIRQPVELAKPVHAAGEGGFLGLLLSPDFPQSRQAYAYHTYEEDGQVLNRIAILEHTESSWLESRPLLEGIPGGNTHNGGRLAWGPDGMIYATTGDAGDRSLSQQPDSLAGKILRIAPDGSVPEDNPTAGSYVYSSGHRNPQGLDWDEQGRLFSAEHGPNAHDELNLIEAGANYGWPEIQGDEEQEGMMPPLYHTGEDTLAPSGLAVLPSGEIVIAGLRGERLARFAADGSPIEDVLDGVGRLRDVVYTDGGLYVLTNNTDGRGSPTGDDDRLLRIDWQEAE